MNLIIVESPTKSKTIQKFLGKDYKVLSSFGHVRDLPKGELGVDVENDFQPRYVIPPKARKTIKALKEEFAKADSVILATDEDREGEAISWHLKEVLAAENPKRIVFHEITKEAIQEALKNPRTLDMNLVDAQQARRILDRIVGYKLSPFLWKKISRGLSAGRVQSVAVRLVVEREEEIKKFNPQEYWAIIATLLKTKDQRTPACRQAGNTKPQIPNEFEAQLVKKNDKPIPKLGITSQKEAEKIIKDLAGAEYKVQDIEKKEVKKNPLPPFTTSTLQQTAWKRLHFPAKFTMRLAQGLYERGFITYHRTDSLNLSQISLTATKKFIEENYGKKYWAGYFRKYKARGRTQEAHEAIRPTYPDQTPDKLKEKSKLDDKYFRLYDMIWRRFVASQMATALSDATAVDIEAKEYVFRANGQTLKFEGFLKIYPMKFEEKELPKLEKDEILDLARLTPSQHFTEPPARYSEATLIKALEENGIGRPSTYAPILSTIQERNYITKNEQKKFYPTEIGAVVNNMLVKHFPEVVDIQFTAKLEKELDEVAEGKDTLAKTCRDFYAPFSKNLEKKYKEVSKEDITEKTDKKCPECGFPLIIRMGRYGKFYACSAFPKCKYTDSLKDNSLGIKCPKCAEGQLTIKRTKRGKIFYGCDRYPKCDFALWDKPLRDASGQAEKCPQCGSPMVETKRKQIKCSNKDCQTNQKLAK